MRAKRGWKPLIYLPLMLVGPLAGLLPPAMAANRAQEFCPPTPELPLRQMCAETESGVGTIIETASLFPAAPRQ